MENIIQSLLSHPSAKASLFPILKQTWDLIVMNTMQLSFLFVFKGPVGPRGPQGLQGQQVSFLN